MQEAFRISDLENCPDQKCMRGHPAILVYIDSVVGSVGVALTRRLSFPSRARGRTAPSRSPSSGALPAL